MAYKGQAVRIPMGLGGLHTDDAHSTIPHTRLVQASNVRARRGVLEKEPGSLRWNSAALGAGVVGLIDWIPSSIRQQFVAVTRDGKVWSLPDRVTASEIVASGGAPATLTVNEQVVLVRGGLEAAGRARKLFILSGTGPVQVVSGTAGVRTTLSGPAADWSGASPTFGLIHNGRFVAFGNENDPHRIYLSDPDDHEDFAGAGGLQFSVFPGDGERLLSAAVFNGRLYLFKAPEGVFYLDDSDTSSSNWVIRKQTDAFGVAAAHAIARVKNDLLLKTNSGTIMSLVASDRFGDVESADVLNSLRVEGFVRQNTTRLGDAQTHFLYYPEEQLAYVTYRAGDSVSQNRMLLMDVSREEPLVTWVTKDQPNCLALRKDLVGVLRPYYGAEDGYVYELERRDREVNGAGYEMLFRTPHLDFSWLDPAVGEKVKNFDFLELEFEETGNHTLSVDVRIDREFSETLSFPLTKGATLGPTGTFSLGPTGSGEVVGRGGQAVRLPLHGAGRRISITGRNSGLREHVKITGMIVYFRIDGERQTA